MRLTCLFLILAFPLLVTAQDRCHRGFGGLLISGYSKLLDTGSAMVLGVNAKQSARAQELNEAFFKDFSEEMQMLRDTGGLAGISLQLYFDECKKHKELTTKLNQKVIKDIREVLGSDKKLKEWKQHYTQEALMELEVDTLFALHDIELSEEVIKPLLEEYRRNSISEHDSRLTHVVMSDFLVREKHLTREQVRKASGEPFRGSICRLGDGRGPMFRPTAHMVWQDIPFQILRNPRVQAELKFTPAELKEIDIFIRDALKEMNVSQVEVKLQLVNSGNIKKADFEKQMGEWRDKTKSMLKERLTEEQFTRLWELFYQYNSRRMRLNWCRYLGGKSFDVEKRLGMEMNELQAQTRYEWQAHQLAQGMKLLAGLVGEKEARKMAGEIKIKPFLFVMDEPEKDKEIRARIEAKYSKRDRQKNPRRDD